MRELSKNRHLKNYLSLNLAKSMEILNARAGSIFLFDKERNELVLEIVINPRKRSLRGIRQRLGEGIAGKVAQKRTPLLVEDIDQEPLFASRFHPYDYNSKSFLSIPLEHSGNLLGVVNITEKSSGDTFNDRDLRIALNIFHYLGITLANLRSYLEKQKKIQGKLTKELEHLKKTVTHSEKFSSLGKLVGGVAHEINNPLDGVIRYLNLSLDCLDERSTARGYLLDAKAGLNRIAQFVRTLLDYSWSLSSQSVEIDLNETIEECLFFFNYYFASYNITIKKYLGQGMPKIADLGIKIAFNNIIKNACNALAPGGGTLEVITERSNDFIKVTFKDSGPGIPQHLHNKVFEPFYTTQDIGKGSGLGLTISYSIIQRYKGEILLESQQGKGTTFIIILPLQN
jgi:signal transduction histidine kinase